MSDIYFNSKSQSEWYPLSNFYGNVELHYQQSVAVNGVDELFAKFQTCDSQQFVNYLKCLQPGKTWTSAKEQYWFRDGEPIRGILAKLVAGARTNPGRTSPIQRLAHNFTIRPEATVGQKTDVMLQALRKKFRQPQFRDLLLSTGSRTLHEKPIRGNGSNSLWTYKVDKNGNAHGGDLLGKLLMQVRQELAQPTSSQNRHKRHRTPEAGEETGEDDVIDLTHDPPPAKKRTANDETMARREKEAMALATVMDIVKRVTRDAEKMEEGMFTDVGDTFVPPGLAGIARGLNDLFTDFASSFLSSLSQSSFKDCPDVDIFSVRGAQRALECMGDDSRSFCQLLREIRQEDWCRCGEDSCCC